MPFVWPVIPQPLSPDFGEFASAVRRARLSMLVDSADGNYLSIVGNSFGVPRPPQVVGDEMYRQLVQLLSWLPKTILFTTYKLVEIILGTQASILLAGGRPWKLYEVNPNEFIIELPLSLIAATNANASYLHGPSGYGFVPTGPVDTFTTPGNLQPASATTFVGMTLMFNTALGVWTEYTVVAFSYNPGTNTSTVQVSAATLPGGGGMFYILVPGDGVSSYSGDFLASGGQIAPFSTAAGPPTTTLLVTGDLTTNVTMGDPVQGSTTTTPINTTVVSLSYSPLTNITTVIVVAMFPGGLSNQTFIRAQLVADTSTTPPHDDLVYLTGLGLYEVVLYYLDFLVRASGIVVRTVLI
jgi:hypothetical protein